MPNFPGGWELIVVVVLIMVLFGYKRLPDATRSLGRSLRIFKAETKGLRSDDHTDHTAHSTRETTTTTAHVDPVPLRREPPSEVVRGDLTPEPVRIVPPEQTERRPL